MRARVLILAAGLWLLLVPPSLAQPQGEGTLWENPHRTYVSRYEGTNTCLACHDAQARAVHASVHYQWKADAPNITNAGGKALGKINMSNDFCTNPTVSWIAILKNDAGKVIANGCSKCHTGLGLKPAAEPVAAQLENIDCLVCHSPTYRREVVPKDGGLRWQPVALDKPDTMLTIAQNPIRPTNEMCLRCHVGSGGGINFKRGDLETAHVRASREFDVHMGSGMQCIQCHEFRDHKLIGSGTQMGGADRPGEQPRCESCHKGRIHANAALNRHTASVACTTCHIPTFARHDPTDMRRDWSRSVPVEGEGRFEPAIDFKKNVRPVYAWWNGTAIAGLLDTPVKVEANGKVSLFKPLGSIADPGARIHPFKYHEAKLPIDNETKLMIPIAVGMVFRAGNNAAAVKAGAKTYFGKDVTDVGWIETERYMGLFHEVVPKKDALACNACHSGGDRLDWKALGYAGDPMKTGPRKVGSARK
ncbi:MAG: hypothetical protein HYR51_13650 [Candidatus Rokubacteria bacterium]|nr:hypothetical protein [Candidatus Rokubacteria bacterium]